jgi:hypothetical protein
MKKVKKMAFGGIGRALKNAVKPAAKPVGGPMGSAIKSGNTPMPTLSGGLKLVDPIMDKSAAPTKISPSGGLGGMMSGGAGKALGASTLRGLQGPTAKPGAMMKKGGKVSSASKRADGCATKGKTRGKIV